MSRSSQGPAPDPGEVTRWMSEAAGVIVGIDIGEVERACEALRRVRAADRAIFVAGNGGSATSASHMAADLQKAASPNRMRTRAVSLSDNLASITAWGNDVSFDNIFSEQLQSLAQPDDALVLISVSGSSPNLVNAARAARGMGVRTVGLLGRDGGALASLVDHAVIVRSEDYGWVESAHVVLLHVFTNGLRAQALGVVDPMASTPASAP